MAATNLSAAAETDLRKSLSQRLSKIPNNPNEGNFLSVGLRLIDLVHFRKMSVYTNLFFRLASTMAMVTELEY